MQIPSEKIKSIHYEISENKQIIIETGRLASEANGSVLVSCGETMVLVTCCESKEPKSDIDFFPLTVDFEEKIYAVGRIPGSYNRREGKASDKSVLAGRLIDRPIRPLFPENYHHEVQIVATVLSADQVHSPDVLAILGASAAIELAGLPFLGPVGAVRVGLQKGQFIVNPTYEELKNSPLDLVVAGTEKAILMIEAGANFLKEEVILAGIEFAHKFIKEQVLIQKELISACNINKRDFPAPIAEEKKIKTLVDKLAKEKLLSSIESKLIDKKEREKLSDAAYKAVKEHFEKIAETDDQKDKLKLALAYTNKLQKKLMRSQIMEKGERVDGRKCNEIRPIWSQVGLLPRTHGSGLFTRGSTQALSIVTLGSGIDAKQLDSILPEKEQTYFHHYNFPAFSTGETKSSRGPGRREIGHGALAERALIPALPAKEEFPYVIRVVSEVLSSNGSSSMASTCGSTLALLNAGVPLKAMVGGIAMGLILEGGKCAILSDIQGVEDFLGDMDFKVTGSHEGVTAIQLDLKLPEGISLPILKVALEQALAGRIHILDEMSQTINEPSSEISAYAPRMALVQISTDDIAMMIGPGGKNIKRLIEETGVDKIDIADDGMMSIMGRSDVVEAAKERIVAMTMRIHPGEEYRGIIVRKLPIGLFVEIAPGKLGLLKAGGSAGRNDRGRYNNRRFERRSDDMEGQLTQQVEQQEVNFDEFQVDQEVLALVQEIDQRGRINLHSIRAIV